MNTEYTVALDMDGVLADFDQKVEQIFKKPISEIPKKELWNGIKNYNNNVELFYLNLNLMPGALELFKFVNNNFQDVFILTATGHAFEGIGEQKRKWVAKHLSPNIRVETVRRSEDKAIFANPRTILIDDRIKSTGPWEAAGGIAILFKNSSQAISEIKQYL
jgi:5'(3')-deoxyribonucleotidase